MPDLESAQKFLSTAARCSHRSIRLGIPVLEVLAVLALVAVLACSRVGDEDATKGDAGTESEASVGDDGIHFLIPGATGGGWDLTARGVGEALRRSGLVERVSFENMSGGGGGRALAHLIETASRQERTWMVTSTPILLRSLRGQLRQTWRDLTPIAVVIGDYAVFAVQSESPINDWQEVVARVRLDPRLVKIAGGSVRGGMDHLVAAYALRAAGVAPRAVRYVYYDTGGKALIGLLSGETQLLVTGLGEAIEAQRSGQLRILAVAAPERVAEAPSAPTMHELGFDVEFVNWRGFFGPPGLPPAQADRYASLLEQMLDTPEWEEVRARYGWVPLFAPRERLVSFLEEQELLMAELLRDLGFMGGKR